MQGEIFNRKTFIESENKHSLMVKCLLLFSEVDRGLEQELEGALAVKAEQRERLESRIRAIEADICSKRSKLEELETIISEQLADLENTAGADSQEAVRKAVQLQDSLDEMTEKVSVHIQRQDEIIAGLQRELGQLQRDCEQLKAAYQQKKQEAEGTFREKQEVLRAQERRGQNGGVVNYKKIMPPAILNSALCALKQYDISRLARTDKYLLQCITGTIACGCGGRTQALLREAYPDVINGEKAEVPYLVERDHAVYQMFCYHRRDADTVWQHFQTLCLAQLVLHRKWGYELTLVSGENRSFLERCDNRDRGCIRVEQPASLGRILSELKAYCQEIQRNYLQDRYFTAWEYNKDHPERRIPYKGIALWGVPQGMDAQVIADICEIYGLAERVGVFFLVMADMDVQVAGDQKIQLQKLKDGLDPVEYQPAAGGYADKEKGFVYFIKKYREL